MSPTHYETLEIAESAAQEEIKRAYRRLAKKYHPDRNKKKGAEEKFKEINLAYQVLGDPGRRQSYDATLRASASASATGAPPPPPPPPPPRSSSSATGQASPPPPPSVAQGAYRYLFFVRGLLVGGALVGAVFFFVLIFYAACRTSSANPVTSAGPPEPPRAARAVEAPKSVQASAGPPLVIAEAVPVLPFAGEPRVSAHLEPIAYSYPKNEWAIRHPYLGSGLPHVQRFSFYERVNWGAGMQWDGSSSVSGYELTLVIENLQLLDKPDDRLAKQFDLTELWSDVGVGYHVELESAVFEDHSMAKEILIFRTFAGDTPPTRIAKSFRIIPVPLASNPSTVHLRGEWQGSFDQSGRSVPFVMRLEQNGNEIFGVAIENDSGSRRRTTIRGWVMGSTVTFLKTGEHGSTVSCVSADSTSKELRGTWERRKDRGSWQAEWKRDFTDSVDDLPTKVSDGNPAEPASLDTPGADRSEGQSSDLRHDTPERDHYQKQPTPSRSVASERDRSQEESWRRRRETAERLRREIAERDPYRAEFWQLGPNKRRLRER